MTAERVKNLPEDDWRKRSPNFQSPKLERNLALVELLTEIGKAHGVQAGVVAIAWTLRHPAITAAMWGGGRTRWMAWCRRRRSGSAMRRRSGSNNGWLEHP